MHMTKIDVEFTNLIYPLLLPFSTYIFFYARVRINKWESKKALFCSVAPLPIIYFFLDVHEQESKCRRLGE